jgi:hypothetical protein
VSGASPARALERFETALLRLLELMAEPDADALRMLAAWDACERSFAELPAWQELGRQARGEAALAERLRSVARLNGLVLESARRQRALASRALGRLNAQRDSLAFWRRDGSGGSCDVTG